MTLEQIETWREAVWPLIEWGALHHSPGWGKVKSRSMLKRSHGLFLWWDSLQSGYWELRHRSQEGRKE